jgi:hypothetical protein
LTGWSRRRDRRRGACTGTRLRRGLCTSHEGPGGEGRELVKGGSLEG